MEFSFTWRRYRVIFGLWTSVVRSPAGTGKQAIQGNESRGMMESSIQDGSGDNFTGSENGHRPGFLSDEALGLDTGEPGRIDQHADGMGLAGDLPGGQPEEGLRIGETKDCRSGQSVRTGEIRDCQSGVHFYDVSKARGSEKGRSTRSVEKQTPEEYLYQLALTVISEIRPGIRAAAKHKLGRAELILSLRRQLRNYASLTASRALPFRVAINHVIVSEAAIHCCIHLDKEELSTLWRPAGWMEHV